MNPADLNHALAQRPHRDGGGRALLPDAMSGATATHRSSAHERGLSSCQPSCNEPSVSLPWGVQHNMALAPRARSVDPVRERHRYSPHVEMLVSDFHRSRPLPSSSRTSPCCTRSPTLAPHAGQEVGIGPTPSQERPLRAVGCLGEQWQLARHFAGRDRLPSPRAGRGWNRLSAAFRYRAII